MSLLVVGLSHRSAPVGVLERTALTSDASTKLLLDAIGTEPVDEALLLATCNRVELYANVDKFHAALAELSALLARHSEVPLDELTPHLYVHYEDRAVHHAFSVACGLDSMVVGEGQVIGQIKDALGLAQRQHTAGRLLNDLFQQALRVGKRVHTDTGIDQAGQSLVTFGLERLASVIGEPAGKRALIVGAGSMSALAAATLARAGVSELVVANRTWQRANRVAAAHGGRAIELRFLPEELARADLVVTCTGANDLVLTRDSVSAAATGRSGPLAILDLAMPRDVDPAVHQVHGVHLVDLELLAGADIAAQPGAVALDQARRIVAEEVAAFGAAQRAAQITPTVVALRTMAADVVASELARLDGRLPDLDARSRAEITQTVRRVVDKLLHAPTVRVKQLAGEAGGAGYADALRELFGLDPRAVDAVSRADTGHPNRGRE